MSAGGLVQIVREGRSVDVEPLEAPGPWRSRYLMHLEISPRGNDMLGVVLCWLALAVTTRIAP